jgi:tetratricopeptide (TPR) repeat protein
MGPWDWMNFGGKHAKICDLLRRIGRYKEARPFIDRAIHIHERLTIIFPNTIAFAGSVQGDYILLGHLELACGETEAATTSYMESLRLAEIVQKKGLERALPQLLLSCPVTKVRDPQRACSLLENVIISTPEHAGAWKMLALARYRTGQPKRALQAVKEARYWSGRDYGFAGFVEAMAHWQLGEKDEARQCYEQTAKWLENTDPGDEDLCLERDEAAALLGINPSGKTKEERKDSPQSTLKSQSKK